MTGNESLDTLLRTIVPFELLLCVKYYEKHHYITQKIKENSEHHENLYLAWLFETKFPIYNHLERK